MFPQNNAKNKLRTKPLKNKNLQTALLEFPFFGNLTSALCKYKIISFQIQLAVTPAWQLAFQQKLWRLPVTEGVNNWSETKCSWTKYWSTWSNDFVDKQGISGLLEGVTQSSGENAWLRLGRLQRSLRYLYIPNLKWPCYDRYLW